MSYDNANAVMDAEVVSAKTVTTTAAVAKVDEQKPKTTPTPPALPDLQNLSPQQFAQICLSAGLFKDATTFAQMAVKIRLGARMGLDEATALSGIIIVNGRISFTANLIAARIKQSGKYRYDVVKKTDKECSLQLYEKVEEYLPTGQLVFKWHKPGPPEVFTYAMGERAGLVSSNPTWKKYPEAMLFARCLTAMCRTYCSDVLVGVTAYTPDEIDPGIPMTVTSEGEIVIVDGVQTPPPVTTKALSAPKPDLLSTVQDQVKKTGFDVGPLLDQYGVKSLDSMTQDQLKAASRIIQQKAGAK